MSRIRLLWLIAALCLVATACPGGPDPDFDGDGIPDSDDPDIDNDGEPNESDFNSFNPDVIAAPPESDEPEPDDAPLETETADEPDEEPVEAEPEPEPEPAEPEPLDLTIDLNPGEAYLDDDLLETDVSMTLDPVTGLVSVTAGPEVRSDGWHGITFFATAPDGTEGEIQCSFRPDIAASDPAYAPTCNSFGLPTFAPCGEVPFTDIGEGPMTVDRGLQWADGSLVFEPENVPPGDCDFTDAVISGGFVGTCDANFSCQSAVFEDGFESGDTTAWSAAVP